MLDSIWDVAAAAVPSVPTPPPKSQNANPSHGPKPKSPSSSPVNIQPRSPSPEPEYSDPDEWLDLQGPADDLIEIGSNLSDVEREMSESRAEQRRQFSLMVENISPEEIVLNNDVVHDLEDGEESL